MEKKILFKKITVILLAVIILGLVVLGLNRNNLQEQYDELMLNLHPKQELNVPLENQLPDLPNGCEVTSLSMLLRYYKIDVNKLDLSQKIAHVSSYTDNGRYHGNPHRGFVGYMSQANAGWCVYNEPLTAVAGKYTNRIRNYTGHNFTQVIHLVQTGHPVMIITTLTFNHVNDMQTWQTKQGKVHVTPSSHACVITGYDKKARIVYVNDPYGTKNKHVNWHNLEQSYNQQGKQALYVK